MIKIIAKGYKYLLTQIDDFLGSLRTIVISLKSIKGRKEYEKLFGRKLDDQKTNIKIRIISLKQSRLTDFISNLFEKSMSRYSIFDQMLSEYSNLKILFIEKINKNKRHCKVRNVISIFQKVLSDFFGEGFTFLKRKICIPYKINLLVVHSKDYMESVLPWNQVLAFQHFKKFHGYIGDMFALNPSLDNFFIELQASMDYHPQHESLNFNNIIKLEIARCKMGYSNFESFIREFNQNKALRNELNIENRDRITLSSYRRNLKCIYPYLVEYAQLLIQECRNLNLIGDKIWIWDRRFFECNCSGLKNKKTGMLSDPDAGHYVKKTGTYSVLSGTGYTDTCVVDSWWGLPVYWDAVNASKNDNTIFQETIIQCMKSETHKPLFMVADAGPDSHTSNQVVIDHGVIPIIAARANSVGTILKTETGTHFRGIYIPRKFHILLGKIYNLRTIVERKNSNEVVGYNRSKTPTRRIEWAKMFVSIGNITSLLTALTAFKVGRKDLIRAPTAFRRLHF